MRFRLALAAATMTLLTGAAPQPQAKSPAPAVQFQPRLDVQVSERDCPTSQVHHADRRGGEGLRVNRLGELPPGNLELTVMREVDGCQEPVIVRQGFGAKRKERR
jgi:hypothetical protein